MSSEEKYLISLVVPAYQAQGTLSETLDAALAQDFNSFQIVVDDDGSSDNTLSIAQSYADKHKNMKVINQENKGTGGAYDGGVSPNIMILATHYDAWCSRLLRKWDIICSSKKCYAEVR